MSDQGHILASRNLRRALVAIVLFDTILLIWLLSRPGGAGLDDAVENALQLIAPSGAVLLCTWDGRRVHRPWPPRRTAAARSWIPCLGAIGLGSTVAGQTIFLIASILGTERAMRASLTDLFDLVAYMFLLAVVLLLPRRPLTATQRLRAGLDGLLVVVAALSCAWPITVGPMVLNGPADTLTKVTYVAYPLGDCLLLACVLMLWVQDFDRLLLPVVELASASLALLAVADSVQGAQILNGTYHYGDPVDAAWPLAVLLAGLAMAVLRHKEQAADPADTGREAGEIPMLVRVLLPYSLLPLVATVALGTWRLGADHALLSGVLLGGSMLVMLVLSRQIVVLVENYRLQGRLAGRQARLSALQRLTATLAVVHTPDEIMAAVIAEGKALLGDAVIIPRLLSEDGDWLERPGDVEPALASLFPARLPTAGNPLVSLVLRTRQAAWEPILTAAGPVDGLHLPGLVAAGFRAVAILPLSLDGGAAGTLLVAIRSSSCFQPEQREFLTTLASLTAQALDRARLYVHERERARAAAELANMRAGFVASVSHELRTPLTAIVGYGELLAARWEQLSDEARKGHVQRIVLSANRQKKLVEDLLLVGRLDMDALAVECAPIDLATQVRHAVAEVQAGYAGQTIERTGPAGIAVHGEANRVVQVLVNLLDNAAKYSPDGSPVEIEWTVSGEHAVVRVRDFGMGIPAHGQDRLFTRFGRVPGSRARAGRVGTGLGLYLGRQMARAMGGELDLESTGVHGSTFRLVLPLATQ